MTGPVYLRLAAEEAAAALEANLLDATSTDSFSVPAAGDTITIEDVGSGKEMQPRTIWKWGYTGDTSKNFTLLVSAYDGTDVTGVALKVSGAASGPYTSWAGSYMGQAALNFVGVSTSSNSVGSGAKTFTTQTGKTNCPVGTYLLISDGDNSANYIVASVVTYTSGTGQLDVYGLYSGGSGTFTNWSIEVCAPALYLEYDKNFNATVVALRGGFQLKDTTTNDYLALECLTNTITDLRSLQFNVNDANRLLTITADTTLNGTPASAATQAEQEAASVTNAYTSPGRQHYHPAHPKAIYSATVTPTAVAAAASVDTATEIITWAAAHGIPDGTCIWPSSATPAGATVNTAYYFHALSATTGTLHLTLANALAGTSAVNLTSSTAMVSRQLVYSSAFSYGMAASAPVAYVVGGTPIGLEFNISPALSAAAGLADLSFTGIVASTTAVADNTSSTPFPSGMTTSVITFDNASLTIVDAADGLPSTPLNIQTQALTAFKVQFKLWGDQ